jgi:hypothetical protein
MKAAHVLIAALFATSLTACGPSPARFKVTQINSANGDSRLFSYNGTQLSSIRVVSKSGTVIKEQIVAYKDGHISSVTSGRPGNTPLVWTISYLDGRMSTLSTTDPANASSTFSTSYTYTDGRLSRAATLVAGSSLSYSSTIDYSYTDGKLTHAATTTAMTSGGSTQTSTNTIDLAYDSNDLVTSMTGRFGTSSYVGSFTYDDKKRIQTFSSGGDTFTVEYTEDKVSRVIITGSNPDVLTFTYDQGEVDDFIPTLSDAGAFFDLAGRMLPVSENNCSLNTIRSL